MSTPAVVPADEQLRRTLVRAYTEATRRQRTLEQEHQEVVGPLVAAIAREERIRRGVEAALAQLGGFGPDREVSA